MTLYSPSFTSKSRNAGFRGRHRKRTYPTRPHHQQKESPHARKASIRKRWLHGTNGAHSRQLYSSESRSEAICEVIQSLSRAQ